MIWLGGIGACLGLSGNVVGMAVRVYGTFAILLHLLLPPGITQPLFEEFPQSHLVMEGYGGRAQKKNRRWCLDGGVLDVRVLSIGLDNRREGGCRESVQGPRIR